MKSPLRRSLASSPVIQERYDPEDSPQPLPIRNPEIFYANDGALEKIAQGMEENIRKVRYQSPSLYIKTKNGKKEREDIYPVEEI